MLDSACGILVGGAVRLSSIPPSATDQAAVTVAAAALETTARPPLSVGVDVTATAVTTAADVADDARLNLPTSLVERRKRRASVYCTREYFYFICAIESIYLANLTLKMMMAYNDGDIVAKIKLGILSHIDTRNRFSCLSGSDNRMTIDNFWFT